eukprot:9070285-Pyramimonas_sp.AAC.1
MQPFAQQFGIQLSPNLFSNQHGAAAPYAQPGGQRLASQVAPPATVVDGAAVGCADLLDGDDQMDAEDELEQLEQNMRAAAKAKRGRDKDAAAATNAAKAKGDKGKAKKAKAKASPLRKPAAASPAKAATLRKPAAASPAGGCDEEGEEDED